MNNLNEHQKRLLLLIKELDCICKKYNIQYYCAGGTVIGAARHRGFIPWDDDIDIYMRRSEFAKLRKAFKIEKPKDRALVFRETDEDYFSVIPRYLDTSSTMFCKYNMLGYAPAGTLIDIFIIDPIPNDKESQREYLNKLFVYSDLIMPFYSFSHRVRTEDLNIFERYYLRAKKVGLETIIKELNDDIFSYTEEDCDYLCLRWGSIPTIFPKSIFGNPVYLEFEDLKLPMPENWYEYLCILYGGNWMMVPYAEKHNAHMNIQRYDMTYHAFYDYRDNHFSSSDLLDFYMKRKQKTIEYEPYLRMRNDRINNILSEVIVKGLKKELKQNSTITIEKARKLLDLYFEKQFSVGMAGMLAHGHYYRWMYPFVIDINEDMLEMIVDILAYNADYDRLSKLFDLYDRAGKNTIVIDCLGKSLKILNHIKALYYYGEYNQCQDIAAQNLTDKYIGNQAEEYYRLAQAKTHPQKLLNELDSSCDVSENISMAIADALYAIGDNASAETKYRQIAEYTRNGMFWMKINEKFDVPDIPLDKHNEYIPNDINVLEKQLIDEIVDVCDKNGIMYVLGPHLSRRLYVCNNFGYEDEQKNIYMDADNAAKFLHVMRNNMPKSRRIYTWVNHRGIYNFEIRYSDNNSVYVRLGSPYFWNKIGVNVRIIIIRSGSASKKYKRLTRFKEYCLAQNTLRKSDLLKNAMLETCVTSNLANISNILNNNYKQTLFEEILKGELDEPQSRYYFLRNKFNNRPLPIKFYDEDWLDTTFFEYKGRKYRIPLSATEPHFRNEIDKSNERKSLSHSILYTNKLNWDDLSPVLEKNPINIESKRKYTKVYKELSDATKFINRSWQIMLCYDDSISLTNDISPQIELLQKLQKKNDYIKIGDILSELDIKMKYYLKREIKMQLPDDIIACYYDYLNATSQSAYINKFEKL